MPRPGETDAGRRSRPRSLLCALCAAALATPGAWAAAGEAPYRLVQAIGQIEVRSYPARTVLETDVSGERDDATRRGLRLLTDYLAGRDRPPGAPASRRPSRVALPFAQPLLRTETSFGWVLQLDLPSGTPLSALPGPADPAVRIRFLPPQSCIVTQVRGTADFQALDRQRRRAEDFARTHGLTLDGPPTMAFYNGPDAAWFLKRAELRSPVDPPD